jgi:aquaporin Z
MNTRALAAEFIGTFVLAFLVFLSITLGLPIETPVVAGLTLGFFVYAVGSVSGAHLNPAVTVGLLAVGKIKPRDAVGYVIVQMLAGFAALAIGQLLLGGGTQMLGDDDVFIVFSEGLGAFILLLGISAVAHGRVSAEASGLTIGSALTLGILAASAGSYGVLNPAVAIAVGTLSVSYLAAPVGGAIVGALVYRALLGKKR